MNTISIVTSILIPIVVFVYIIVDLFSRHKIKSFPKMLYDEKIDEILADSNGNHGERKSQQKIIDNTNYILDNYNDVFKI